MNLTQGWSAANPGLELANAFGVIIPSPSALLSHHLRRYYPTTFGVKLFRVARAAGAEGRGGWAKQWPFLHRVPCRHFEERLCWFSAIHVGQLVCRVAKTRIAVASHYQ